MKRTRKIKLWKSTSEVERIYLYKRLNILIDTKLYEQTRAIKWIYFRISTVCQQQICGPNDFLALTQMLSIFICAPTLKSNQFNYHYIFNIVFVYLPR